MSLDNFADMIRKRAYEIWEGEGRPHGRDVQHWFQAETEFRPPLRVVAGRSVSRAPAKKPARPRKAKAASK